MVTTKVQSLLQFHSDHELSTQGYLHSNGMFEALHNRSFYILVYITLRRPRETDRHKASGRLNDEIYKIINTNLRTSNVSDF